MKNLKPSVWHLAIWLALAVLTGLAATQVCLQYNVAAGTDLTRGQIILIGVLVLFGPMVGLIANPGGGEVIRTAAWTGVLMFLLLASLAPFCLLKRTVTTAMAAFCWTTFLIASLLWFCGALFSLAYYLS